MDIRFSERALGIEEGIFSVLNTKKEELIKAGRTVYNFSVGTPDFKTPDHIMKAMQEACKDPENYKYALADRPEMLEAMRDFYQTRPSCSCVCMVRRKAWRTLAWYSVIRGM